MVVEGLDDSRLAIELDGDKYHGIERWVEDVARQRMLERMGWVFWRCWGSNYISDKEECLNDLINRLDSLKIDPIGYQTAPICGVCDHRMVGGIDVESPEVDFISIEEPAPENAEESKTDSFGEGSQDIEEEDSSSEGPQENGHQSEAYVQINDTVSYAYEDNPDDVKMVQIVRGKANVSEGVISHTSPIAQTILGAFLGEKVTAHLPTGPKQLQILKIVKS
jgi:transcription elongation GreA/GreB family factor